MVATVKTKDGKVTKYAKTVWVSVMQSHPDKLYIQTRLRGSVKETFIDLADIVSYHVKQPI